MKLKRFLSFAVALAMVLSIVPAMSLTASAADASTITMAEWHEYAGNALFTYPTNLAGGDRAMSEYGAGWSSSWAGTNNETNANGAANVDIAGNGKYWQVYGPTGSSDTLVFPGFGEGKDFVIFEYWTTRPTGDANASFYHDYAIKDLDGKVIETGSTSRTDGLYSGASAGGTHTYASVHPTAADDATVNTKVHTSYNGGIRIVFVNNDNDTYSVIYYTAGNAANKEFDEGTYTGTYQNSWSDSNWYKAYTATYTGQFNGLGSVEYTVRGCGSDWWNNHSVRYPRVYAGDIPAAAKEIVATYTVNGEAVHTDRKIIDTAETNVAVFPAYGYSANGTNVMYYTEGAELSENGEIALEVVANTGELSVGEVFAKDGVQYEIKSDNLIPNGDFSYGTAGWYNGTLTDVSFLTANGDGTATVTKSDIYGGAATADALHRTWDLEVGKKYLFTYYAGSSDSYNKVSQRADIATADGTVLLEGGEGTITKVFDATDEYLLVAFRWLSYNDVFGNFGLYEIAEAEVAVQETVASVGEIASVKVIGDTTVVLPTTVKVTGSLDSKVDAPIVWDAPESYEVGTTEVTGTATVQFGEQEPTTTPVSTTVTVLEETFTLPDLTSVNGQDAAKAAQLAFPVAISDEFSIEFNVNYTTLPGDLWIALKTKDAGFFTPEQIALGADKNSAGFRPVNGNGTGGRTVADYDHFILEANKDYRYFLTTDASTKKYTVYVFDAATGVKLGEAVNYGYRTNADKIEVLAALTNNGAGEVTVSNIKVNANVSKTEYTFNITKDGETTTTTASFWTVDEAKASIADIEGYEKAVEVDGTTINVVYSNVYTAHATFIDADDNTVKVVDVEVKRGESYTVAAEDVFFLKSNYEGHLYYIPETVISEENNNLTVLVQDDPNKYPAIEDALITGVSEIWGIKATNENSVFVASAGSENAPAVDANGEKNHDSNHTPSTLGTSRKGFFLFPVVDVEEGQKVTANFYVRTWHGNGFSNGNQTLRLAAYAVTDNSWATLSDGDTSYVSADAPLLESWNTPVFSEWCYNNPGYITFDITEMMVAAKAAGLAEITLRLNAPYGAAYIAEREAAVAGGQYEDKVAYIQVEDANLVKVTETGAVALTKNGSAMNGFAYVAATDDVRLVSEGALVVNTDAGYYDANTTMSIAEATDFANTAPAKLGLGMAGGAQVRIGNTKLEDGAKLDALADSGLRFLATADYADTVLADTEVEFGIKVTAEASSNAAYVPAVNFQNDDNTVFSAAITNLKENNYNRKYTACAYAKVPMADGTVKEFTTGEVTRSIYQVSAGIMKNGAADTEDAYTVDDVVKNILNAYVNQTGIRLTVTTDGVTVEDGKYTGDVFFTVESVSDGDDGFNVTITPDTSWATPAEIAEWWTDYVRFNNNNSIAKGYISEAAFVDGVLTFNFDKTADAE